MTVPRGQVVPILVAGFLLASFGWVPGATAQHTGGLGHVALLAGPVNYDLNLSGSGWSWGAAGRIDIPVARILSLEFGIGYFQYSSQYGTRVGYAFPEVGLHFLLPTPFLRPYLLAGTGAALSPGVAGNDIAAHAGVGLRTASPGRYGVRVEGRFRNIIRYGNSSLFEVFLGFSRRW